MFWQQEIVLRSPELHLLVLVKELKEFPRISPNLSIGTSVHLNHIAEAAARSLTPQQIQIRVCNPCGQGNTDLKMLFQVTLDSLEQVLHYGLCLKRIILHSVKIREFVHITSLTSFGEVETAPVPSTVQNNKN